MPESTSTQRPDKRGWLKPLAGARDQLRMRLHLLSLDARQRWRDHEPEALATASGKVQRLVNLWRDIAEEVQGQGVLSTLVAQVMTSARTCSPNDTLVQAARTMWELDCGIVPVVDEYGRLQGVITDRDIAIAAYTQGTPLSQIRVESTMSREVETVQPQDSLRSAIRKMGERQLRRLPVVEGETVVGIIALADIARHVDAASGSVVGGVLELAHAVARISTPLPRSSRTRQQAAA